MNVWVIVLIVLVFLYLTEKALCTIYCKSKKKKDFMRLSMRRGGEAVNSYDAVLSGKHGKGLSWKVKQLLNGYMLYSVARLGRVPSQMYRKFILKYVYQMELADNVVIYGDFRIKAPWNIVVEEGTVIGDGCQLDGRNGLFIGKNVNFSTDVFIYTEQHDINAPYFESGNSGGPVVIGDRAWISSRTTILPNVSIGEGAVLASAALATKDLDAYGVYGGVPAKKIGERNHNLKYEFDGNFLSFF